MPSIFLYLLKVSLSLGVVYLFYFLVLRKLTFYNWNRWYLLGYSILSFFVALINIGPFLQRNELVSQKFVQWVPILPNTMAFQGGDIIPSSQKGSIDAWQLFYILLFTGMVIMLCRFFIQLYSVNRIRSRARLLSDKGVKMFEVEDRIIPFSFGNAIFFNRKLHSAEELEEIIRHEFVHVKQRHTIDILWSELLCLINWYNPFAWLIKSAIRQNLEFIADNKVVQHGLDKKQYQYLLLKVVGNNQFSIASKFNFVSLKKRIAMMNKLKTARVHALRFLFLIPLLSVLLLAFRHGDKKAGPGAICINCPQKPDSLPSPPPPPPVPKAKQPAFLLDTVSPVKELNSKNFYIDILGKGPDCVVVVKDKDHKEVKRLLLTEWNAKEDHYTGLYGEILPPPPPSPESAKLVVVPRTIAKDLDIDDGIAKLTLADGTIEKYDLKDKSQLANFEKKYGKVISLDSIRTTTIPGTPSIAVISTKGTTANVNTAELTNVTVEPAQVSAVSTTTATVYKVSNTSPVVAVVGPIKKELTSIAVVSEATVVPPVEEATIVISKFSSKTELEEFKKKLKAKGVDLQFTEVNYNAKGVLTHIRGTLKSKHSENNFSATDFSQVLIIITEEDGEPEFKLWIKTANETI